MRLRRTQAQSAPRETVAELSLSEANGIQGLDECKRKVIVQQDVQEDRTSWWIVELSNETILFKCNVKKYLAELSPEGGLVTSEVKKIIITRSEFSKMK